MDTRTEYDQWHQQASTFETDLSEQLGPWHRTVLKLLELPLNARVLEIGCGRGDFAIRLKRMHSHIQLVAIDFSEVAIAVAKKKALARSIDVDFRVGDAENLPLAEDSFDFLLSCECLEHVPHPDRMAEEIYRVLVPGGAFILTTENYFNGMLLGWLMCWVRSKPFNSGSGVQPHENFFLFWTVKRILKRSGLRVQHMESNHFQWLLLPRCSPARLCTEDFSRRFLKVLFRPFGRHFTFQGVKPILANPHR